MKYIIITGASKGLGEGTALALLHEDHHLLCIARGESEQLKQMAAAKGCRVDFFRFDLAATNEIPALAARVFERVDPKNTTGIYLVNNAGTVEPVSRVEDCDTKEIDLHIRINLLAPMALSSAFIRHTRDLPVEKRVLNISSGAAHSPYYGWSCYCTGKAGIEMFGRCIAEEQKEEEFPVETMSVAPGVIDTNMQGTIRGTSKRDFVHREKFVELKESGQLIPPTLAGKKIAHLLLSGDFSDGESVDIRESY